MIAVQSRAPLISLRIAKLSISVLLASCITAIEIAITGVAHAVCAEVSWCACSSDSRWKISPVPISDQTPVEISSSQNIRVRNASCRLSDGGLSSSTRRSDCCEFEQPLTQPLPSGERSRSPSIRWPTSLGRSR